MLGFRVLLREAMAEAGQAALEGHHAPQPPQHSSRAQGGGGGWRGGGGGSGWKVEQEVKASPPRQRRSSSSSSVEASKWLKVAEVMAGLRSAEGRRGRGQTTRGGAGREGEGGVVLVRGAVGGVARAADAAAAVRVEWQFSGAAAVRWLLDAGLAATAATALYAGQHLLEEGHIHLASHLSRPPHRAATAAAAGGATGGCGFYLSSSILYELDHSLRWEDGDVSAADVQRLGLEQQPHASLIQQLCQHYNHKAEASTASSSSTPGLASSRTASPVRVRSAVWPDGLFLGVELVRWLRRQHLIERTRDGWLWGHFLLQHHIIALEPHTHLQQPHAQPGGGHSLHDVGQEEKAEERTTARKSAPRSPLPSGAAAPFAGFRLGVARYRLLHGEAEQRRRRSSEEQKSGPWLSPSASSSSLLPSFPSSSSSSSFAAAGPAVFTAVTPVAPPPPPPSPPVDPLIPLAELRRRPSFLEPSPVPDAGAGAVDGARGAGGVAASAGVACVSCAAAEGWEFVQSFGDDASAYDFTDADDLVTAVEFDHSGRYLAIGDKAGRVSIVEEADAAGSGGIAGRAELQYGFYTEFSAFAPDFDSLKSCEVSPSITALEWLHHPHTSSMQLLTSNEKTVQLYRIDTHTTHMRKQQRQQRWAHSSLTSKRQASGQPLLSFAPSLSALSSPLPPYLSADGGGVDGGDDDDAAAVSARSARVYRGVHAGVVHSVSASCDGSTFLSADELRLLLFDVQHSMTAVAVVDVAGKQTKEGEGDGSSNGAADGGAVEELLTVARFHPSHPSLLCHGSSSGLARLVDLRVRFSTAPAVAAFTAAHVADAHAQRTEPPHTAPHDTSSSSSSALPVHSTALAMSGYIRSITDSICDLRWTVGGGAGGGSGGGSAGDVRYVVTRDYWLLRVWDLRQLLYPVYVSHVHPQLLASLPLLLEAEALFDSFQLACAPDGRQMVSGTYANSFTLHHASSTATRTIHCKDDSRIPHVTQQLHNQPLHAQLAHAAAPQQLPLSVVRAYQPPLPSSDHSILSPCPLLLFPPSARVPPPPSSASATSPSLLQQRVLRVAWHPHRNAVAVAGLYKLFLYQQLSHTTQQTP